MDMELVKFNRELPIVFANGTSYTANDINGIVCGALEGGCNYWMGIDIDRKGVEMYISDLATVLIIMGKSIQLYDIEDEEETWELDIMGLRKGIEMNHVRNPDKDNFDADDYDRIFQYALFGKMVYG